MAAFTKGQNFSIKIGSDQYNTDLKAATCEPDDGEDADYVTFARYSDGDTEKWYIRGTGLQDFSPDSLWTYAWLNSGSTVPFEIAPYGNPAPSATQPHFTGDVRISRKPPVGGTAGEEFEFEVEWEVEGVPERVTA